MARRRSATFTEVELEFMHIIWEMGEVSTEDVLNTLNKRGRNLSDGSIRKILSILVAKGHVVRRRFGRSYLYRAKVERDMAQRSMVQDLLKRAFHGSISLMVAALFDRETIDEEELDEVKKLIEEHEQR